MTDGKDFSAAWRTLKRQLLPRLDDLHPDAARQARALIEKIDARHETIDAQRDRIERMGEDIDSVHKMTGWKVLEEFGSTMGSPYGSGPLESKMRMKEQFRKIRERDKAKEELQQDMREVTGLSETLRGIVENAAPPPRPHLEAAEDPSPEPPGSITVERGDTLWDLAGTHLGDPHRWREIYRLPENRAVIGDDPNLILPGQLLKLPAAAADVDYPPDELWGDQKRSIRGSAPQSATLSPPPDAEADFPPDRITPQDFAALSDEREPQTLDDALDAVEPRIMQEALGRMQDRLGDAVEVPGGGSPAGDEGFPPDRIRPFEPGRGFLPPEPLHGGEPFAPVSGHPGPDRRGPWAGMDPTLREAFERAFEDQRQAGEHGFEDLLRRAEGWAERIERAPGLPDVDALRDLGDMLDEPPDLPDDDLLDDDMIDVPADWNRD